MSTPVHRRRHRSRKEIAAILDKFDHSELSALAFAERENLAVSTLRLWLSRRGGRPGSQRGPILVPVHVVGPATGDEVVFEVLLAAVCEALGRPCLR